MNVAEKALSIANITANENETIDLMLDTMMVNHYWTVTSVEASGVNTLQWSQDGTNFYPLEEFTDALKTNKDFVFGIRYCRVVGAATEVKLTVVLI